MKCYIFSGGKMNDYIFLYGYDFKTAMVICADGGYEYTQQIAVVPNVIVGDEDSVRPGVIPDEVLRLTHNMDKDKSDTRLAVEYAMDNGADDITIFGALGGRFDHEFANLLLLKYIHKKGGRGALIDDKNEIYLVERTTPIEIAKNDKRYVSLLPLTPHVTGVTTQGLKYRLTDAILSQENIIGISNEITKIYAYISVSSGQLLVVRSKD